MDHDNNTDLANSINIFNQNIRGLRSKSKELIHSFEIDNTDPHILCLSENHMKEQEVLHLKSEGCTLESSFCQKHLQTGSVWIFARKDMNVNKIDISQNCKERDLEICAVELKTKASKLIILSIYRAPTGDFNRSLKNLDDTVKYLHKPKAEFLICGDINTDYLSLKAREKELSSLLAAYNLFYTLNFSTILQNKSNTWCV